MSSTNQVTIYHKYPISVPGELPRDYKRNLALLIPFVFVFIFNWKKLKEDVWVRGVVYNKVL